MLGKIRKKNKYLCFYACFFLKIIHIDQSYTFKLFTLIYHPPSAIYNLSFPFVTHHSKHSSFKSIMPPDSLPDLSFIQTSQLLVSFFGKGR
jgi:hypothetical protein